MNSRAREEVLARSEKAVVDRQISSNGALDGANGQKGPCDGTTVQWIFETARGDADRAGIRGTSGRRQPSVGPADGGSGRSRTVVQPATHPLAAPDVWTERRATDVDQQIPESQPPHGATESADGRRAGVAAEPVPWFDAYIPAYLAPVRSGGALDPAAANPGKLAPVVGTIASVRQDDTAMKREVAVR